jgi:hypothetical protein
MKNYFLNHLIRTLKSKRGAILKSGDSSDQLKIDPTSKALRATLYDSFGKEINAPNSLCPKFTMHSGNLVVLATAHTATAGYFWIINPVGNSKNIKIRKILFRSAPTTALACLTAPRINIERVTFTGTASGAQITPAKIETSESNATGLVLTASTGLSLSAGAVICAFIVTSVLTAIGVGVSHQQELISSEDGEIILAPGEGIICRQADAGTTSDTRKIILNLTWEEYTP